MSRMPRQGRFDSTLALMADPYRFIGKHCARLGSDVFRTTLLLQPTICMTGPEAAELFYDHARFQRTGAAPELLRATLFGKGAVQGMDGEAHRRRKALFMHALGGNAVADIAGRVRAQWQTVAAEPRGEGGVALYPFVQDVLTRAVCDWAGVPLADAQWQAFRRDLVAMFDSAARGLLPHLRARLARKRAEAWLGRLIDDVRGGVRHVPAGSAVQAVATHLDVDAQLLPSRIAAVELLNLLRPTVAVSVYIVFVGHALLTRPQCREALLAGDAAYRQGFLEEVRRFYPFFPVIAARVREDFTWRGYTFHRGVRTLLDLYGTNHDPRAWHEPSRFDPERFAPGAPGEFTFIPQGGGQPAIHHRCPGEALALALMDAALDFLLAPQARLSTRDAEINERRLPALPRAPLMLANAG